MTATAFEEFLTQHKCASSSSTGIPAETFHPDAPVDDQHINAAEIRLGVPLPASYKAFLRGCGSGGWCGDYVAPPEDAYPLDEDGVT